jgi:hypothetical protein
MFSEFINYIIIPALLSVSAFGAYYIWNPSNGKYVVSNAVWHSVNLYSKATILLEKLDQDVGSISDTDDDDDDEDELLSYYNSKKQIIISLGANTKNIPEVLLEEIKTSDGLLIMQKNTKKRMYKTFNHYEDFMNVKSEWNITEKQFMQVELEQNGKIIDIHKHLDPFYIEGNHILSKAFLQWYLKSMYKIKLSDKYTLKIFDKDINLFSINSDSCIHLEADNYSIISISAVQPTEETDGNTVGDSNYEGALNN